VSNKQDYYEILGVPRDADDNTLKNAYRNLAKKLHPDINQDESSEAQFKDLNEAYGVLSDPEKRAAYDRYGHEGLRGMGINDFRSSGFPFDDIFDQFFGGFGVNQRSSSNQPRRGADLRYDLTITFEQAVHGEKHEIEITRPEKCSHCNGERSEPGTEKTQCVQCAGSGEIKQVQQTFLGSMVNVSICPNCQGSGESILSPCTQCNGIGKNNITRKLSVNIPAGVNNETQIRLSGEGGSGELNGPNGDLYVVLTVTPHKFFQRNNNDIIIELEINISEAALGTTTLVPTIDSQEKLIIPAGTQPGDILKMNKKGVPHVRNGKRGDQIVIISVSIPTQINPEQKKLFLDIGNTLDHQARPKEYKKHKSFAEQVKNILGM
tara:strand:- start:5765 stop:6898 length:1134 start_codon:yes stop_codon:yes gene_type:complete